LVAIIHQAAIYALQFIKPNGRRCPRVTPEVAENPWDVSDIRKLADTQY
jgi:hypothetical protein